MSLRALLQRECNVAWGAVLHARAELQRITNEPALFPAELIEATQNHVIELQHRYTRVQDNFRAACG